MIVYTQTLRHDDLLIAQPSTASEQARLPNFTWYSFQVDMKKSTDWDSNAVPHGQNANVRPRKDVANIIFHYRILKVLRIENDLKRH